MENNILSIYDISISFGGIKAVSNVTMNVPEKKITSLIGPNGAGKTTVFNILTGVYQTQGGSILFRGKEIQNLTPQEIVKAGISRTFQNIRLIPDMKVIENVLIGCHIHSDYGLLSSIFGLPKYKKEEEKNLILALKILKTLGLFDNKDEYAGNLPYGDQRKVEIARAIATGASLILLDEPAAGMNPQESEELLDFIRHLKDLGFTILLIDHDMSIIMNLSDDIYVLENGRMIAHGFPEEIANDPKVIQAYLGGELHVKNQ